jgi:hypothetical protein
MSSLTGRLMVLAVIVVLLYCCGSAVVRLFHWAEGRVDPNSHWHMLLFFLFSLPFHTGLPIPIVHQAWAVAIGTFFRWRAFPILVASMSIGVPFPFLVGRRLAGRRGNAAEGWFRQVLPHGASYIMPLRHAISKRPVYSSFLLMWAPLPTSFLPLLIGFLMPKSQLSFRAFVSGALPSKLLHFACDVLVGIEAGSLAAALDAHDDLPGVNDLPPRHRYARTIAVGAMCLTVAFIAAMAYTMHQALSEMKRDKSSLNLAELTPLSPV